MISRNFTNECIAVAFYGVSADSNSIRSFYFDLIEWFLTANASPNMLSVHGPGFSGKPVEFSKAHSRLSKHGFETIRSFTVFSMLPDGQIPTTDWFATAYLDIEEQPCFVLEARCSIATLNCDHLAMIVRKCISLLRPVYGIGYERSHDKGPGFFAIGLNFDGGGVADEDYEAKLAISRWGDLGMIREVYKDGILRDVYPQNYLSECHLTQKVGSQSLRDWILSTSSNGALYAITDRMTLWIVDSGRIAAIREQLSDAQIIFDWRKYIE